MTILRGGSSNALVGILLIILLAVFAGPGMLPNILPSLIKGADEGIRCEWLRTARDRAEHQSVIGRSARDPITLRIRASALPQQAGETLTITIIVSNRSMGTVPFLFNPDQVRIGDDGVSSGLGVVFNSPARQPVGSGVGPVLESEVRLLQPRQNCVHRIEWPVERIGQLGLTANQNFVKAYYRNTSPGTFATAASGQPIFPDLGLWVGIVESDSVPIPPGGT